MLRRDRAVRAYLALALGVQLVLLVYFATRAWAFGTAMTLGWIVYALALVTVPAGIALARAGTPWYVWLGGLLYGVWAAFGLAVDVVWPVGWRVPVHWPVFVPYVVLYLAATMFFWWPVGRFSRRLWFACGAAWVASATLNVASHGWG